MDLPIRAESLRYPETRRLANVRLLEHYANIVEVRTGWLVDGLETAPLRSCRCEDIVGAA
jgi:hypothetical protein